MSPSETAHRTLLEAVRVMLRENCPEGRNFAAGGFAENLPFKPPAAERLPVYDLLAHCMSGASSATRPVVQAIIELNPSIRWQQSYTLEDGFDRHYLANYGWFNLISPDGPFWDDKIRLSFGYWGSGLHYKEHWHEPEEMYVLLSGRAMFHSEGAPARDCKPGDTVTHTSNQRHSIDILPGPLLAMAIWRGANLNRKSSLPAS